VDSRCCCLDDVAVWRAISAIVFWSVIAHSAPLAFLLAFIILMWASAFRWESALLIGDSISWFTVFRSVILSSILNIRCLCAMLDPAIGQGPGPSGSLSLQARGGTLSSHLEGLGADLCLCLCYAVGCSLTGSLGIGCRRRCWRCSGPPFLVASAD